jgi:hypothetical protein
MTVVLAAVCLASQLSGLAHLALVPHLACAEHGELVELGPGGPEHRSLVQVEASGRVQASPAQVSQRHGHDHCVLAALRRTPACLERGPASVEARPSEEPVAGWRRVAPPGSGLPVLAVAPKSSPPAA